MILRSQTSLTVTTAIREAPPGWRHLVERALQAAIASGAGIIIEEITEYMGVLALCITFDRTEEAGINTRILDAMDEIDIAEDDSLSTCRVCGSNNGARWRHSGEFYTYCRSCKERCLPSAAFVRDFSDGRSNSF